MLFPEIDVLSVLVRRGRPQYQSMMDGGREVPCAVSASAMDDLEHVPRTPAGQREEQFARLRDRIEACASRKFQAREFEGTPPGIIVRSIDFRS